jgi:hypothetical protein
LANASCSVGTVSCHELNQPGLFDGRMPSAECAPGVIMPNPPRPPSNYKSSIPGGDVTRVGGCPGRHRFMRYFAKRQRTDGETGDPLDRCQEDDIVQAEPRAWGAPSRQRRPSPFLQPREPGNACSSIHLEEVHELQELGASYAGMSARPPPPPSDYKSSIPGGDVPRVEPSRTALFSWWKSAHDPNRFVQIPRDLS